MDRTVRDKPLTEGQKKRKREISDVRAPGERLFFVIKTVNRGKRDKKDS